MHWITKNLALVVAIVAVALGGSALGLAIANDGDHHADMKAHHMRDGGSMHHGEMMKGMHHGEMKGMHHGGGMHQGDEAGPGESRGGTMPEAMDHAAHARELAERLEADGVQVTPAQLERAMEATHEPGMGSSSTPDPGTPPRSSDMP